MLMRTHMQSPNGTPASNTPAQPVGNSIDAVFNQYLGRPSSPDEASYFRKFIDEGHLTPYEVGQIIQSTPEYQQKMFQQQAPQLEKMYGANDERILGQAGDSLARRFAQQGRTTTGSAYTQAYMNAARDLAARRQDQMANFYEGGLGQMRQIPLQQGQGAQDRGYGLRDAYRQRQWDNEDWEKQKNYYDQMMNTQNRWGLQNSLWQAGMNLGTGAVGIGLQKMAGAYDGPYGFGGPSGMPGY